MELLGLVSIVAQCIPESVKKRFGFWLSATKNVKDMKDNMEVLRRTEKDMRDSWDAAVIGNEVVSHHVVPWLEDFKRTNEKAESIPAGAVGCFNVLKRYKTGKQAYNTLMEIKNLDELQSKIVFTKTQIPLAWLRGPTTSTPNGDVKDFNSREIIFNAALESLISNSQSSKMIALCGMSGLGKTKMMQRLKNSVQVAQKFDGVVNMVLGENPDPIAIQRTIAEQLHGKDLVETDKHLRASRLCTIYAGLISQNKNKLLVIMDDLLEEFDLKDVGLCPLPEGFKLLFISQSQAVCHQMGSQLGVETNTIFELDVLEEAEAKELFFGIARPSLVGAYDLVLQKIGEYIVEKCHRLPIAIVTIAENLRDKNNEEWQNAVSSLERDDLIDIEGVTKRIFEMSYENLKDEDKEIFLLSSLFPNNFDIRTDDLFRYAWGLNVFKDVKNLSTARVHMKVSVNNLICANLLTESESRGCVKMHDLVHEFVLDKFSKVKQASMAVIRDTKDSYERVLLKCTGMSTFPEDFNFRNLSLLILMDGNSLLKFPEDIHEITKNLEVFSYENMGIPFLPIMVEHSHNLRTLSLHSCLLVDDLSFLESLCNLETLSFAKCKIRRLPSSIGKLKKLKLLDLTGCVHLCIDDGVFQELVRLEELYMRAFIDTPIRFTSANCKELEKCSQSLSALELEFFKNNIQPNNFSFKNLKRFRISIGCAMKYEEKYSSRNTLDLVTDSHVLLKCNISDLFEATEELNLQVKYMENLGKVCSNHSFTNLRVLHVSKCMELTHLFTNAVAKGLQKLERLTVSKCPLMRTLVDEDTRLEKIRFQNLNFMSLDDLPNMVSLCGTMMELPEMKELRIELLPKFTSIYFDDNDPSSTHSLLNRKVVIPKLEKLYVTMMENLNQIWPRQISTVEINNVSMLRKIRVSRCHSLTNIFPSNPLPLLNHLEELELHFCRSIEVLFDIDFKSGSEMKGYVSSLKNIEVSLLEKLKELWRIRGVDNSNIPINGFKGVQSIKVSNCSSFKDIFTPITASFNMSGLAKYSTWYTGEKISQVDDYIPNVTYPSYLLHNCHNLRYLAITCDNRVEEVVFDMDSQPTPLFSHLEVLLLCGLKKMSHVWKWDWNKFLTPQQQLLQFPFENLTKISLRDCHKIEYLFSPKMIKYLSNLKIVHIEQCDGMGKVISGKDYENDASTSTHQTTLLPHLDALEIERMPSLKSIDDGDTTHRSDKLSSNVSNSIHDKFQSGQVIRGRWSLCQYPRKMTIYDCDALSSLVPWYAVGKMEKLEELKVVGCGTMTEVFDSKSSTNNADKGSAHGTTLNITHVVVPQLL